MLKPRKTKKPSQNSIFQRCTINPPTFKTTHTRLPALSLKTKKLGVSLLRGKQRYMHPLTLWVGLEIKCKLTREPEKGGLRVSPSAGLSDTSPDITTGDTLFLHSGTIITHIMPYGQSCCV